MPSDQAAIVLCGMWAIWNDRHARWHGEAPRGVIQPVRWARDVAFCLAQYQSVSTVTCPRPRNYFWRPPDGGGVKINVDERSMLRRPGSVRLGGA